MNISLNQALYSNPNNLPQKAATKQTFRGGNPEELLSTTIKAARKSEFFAPWNSLYNKFTDGVAKYYINTFAKSPFMEAFVGKFGKNKRMVDHLNAAGGIVTSSLYMRSTLKNKKLDKDKKTTLAINQGLVCAVSTIGAYTINTVLDKWTAKLRNRFSQLNHNHSNFAVRFEGFKIAQSLLIFSMMYRYISPVIVTPAANFIGNKFQEYKKQKATAAKEAEIKANEANNQQAKSKETAQTEAVKPTLGVTQPADTKIGALRMSA